VDEKEKTKLSDVLGALVAGVSYGRNVADVQALRIALQYRKNCLLKGLPVPRLRLSRVTISLPLILTAAIPGTPPIWKDPADIAEAARKAFNEGINEELEFLKQRKNYRKIDEKEKALISRYYRFLEFAKNPKVTDEQQKELTKDQLDQMTHTADEYFKIVFESRLRNALLGLDSTVVSNQVDAWIQNIVGDTAEEALRSIMGEIFYRYVEWRITQEKQDQDFDNPFDPDRARKGTEEIIKVKYTIRLINRVRSAAEKDVFIRTSTAPDFHVEVDTDSIKSAGGGPDAVTRLNLVLHEEGLEWLSEKQDGKDISRLLPE
jgi:hypothetical protein